MAAGCVYLVPVPIGNLGDITRRALETLQSVELIAAEDTRQTRFLLSQYEIKPRRLISLHKYNEKTRSTDIIAWLKAGKDLAVVSDAGSPGLSDPAQLLVQSAIREGIRIVPLPGPNSLIPALTASGLDASCFQFLGFLPLKQKERLLKLQQIRDYPYTTAIFEAPHRLRKTLEDIHRVCGSRMVCLARELSKLHEELIRVELGSLLQNYEVTEKGEFVILISGNQETESIDQDAIADFVNQGLLEGKSARALAQETAERFAINRNQAYQLVLKLKGSRS